MSTELSKAVWNAMLDADMNRRYWKRLAETYIQRETWLKIFMAIMASSSVAGWSFWEDHALIWKLLSGLSALTAIAMPILNYQKKLESMSDLAGKWAELMVEYEDMWLTLQAKPSQNTVVSTYKKFRAVESSLEKKEASLPSHPDILKECQSEVNKSRNLQ